MKIIFAFCVFLLGFTNVYAQIDAVDTGKVYQLVQQMPTFNGDINRWLVDHINYPDSASKHHVQGKVYIRFVVEKDGSVSTVQVIRGVAGGAILDSEAVRVIRSMPKWSPGMQNGHAIRCQYMLPINFRLDDSTLPSSPPKDKPVLKNDK